MSKRSLNGWMLLEVVATIMCISLIFGFLQRQQSYIDRELQTTLTNHRLAQQEDFIESAEVLFAIKLEPSNSHVAKPQCLECRQSALHEVLQYELNEW